MYSVTSKLSFIENVFGKGHLASNGKNFDVRCPFCAPSDPNKRKLVIRVEDDVNHCWTCGWKAHTLAPLIRKFGTQEQFRKYRDEFMPEDARTRLKEFQEKEAEKKPLELPKDFRLLTLVPLSDPDAKAAWFYLKKRGLTLRDAWYYKLGLSNDGRWKRRIIMPSFDFDGKLNFFVARNIDESDRRPKYDNPEEDKVPIIFNEINIDWTKRLVICEGPFDLVKCGDNAVALLGSDLNEQSRLFTQILLHNTPVALALDGDMWYKKTPKIAKKLQEYDIDVVIVDTREAGDPGKMSKSQFKTALENAQHPTWTNSFFDKLEKMSEVNLKIKQPKVDKIESRFASRR
jgi:hypothetical protein